MTHQCSPVLLREKPFQTYCYASPNKVDFWRLSPLSICLHNIFSLFLCMISETKEDLSLMVRESCWLEVRSGICIYSVCSVAWDNILEFSHLSMFALKNTNKIKLPHAGLFTSGKFWWHLYFCSCFGDNNVNTSVINIKCYWILIILE